MYHNYLKIVLRNLGKNRIYSFLNIFGLALGMTGCLIIIQYVRHEMSYDKFHENHQSIYRVELDTYSITGELEFGCATNFANLGPTLLDEVPEVEASARLYLRPGVISYIDARGHEQLFEEQKVFQADPEFLNIFSFPSVTLLPEDVLSEPYTAVISDAAARKYFGSENPLGKLFKFTTNFDPSENYKITGVVQSPENSHLKFDFLLSLKTFEVQEPQATDLREYGWNWYDFYTYIKVKPGTDAHFLESKFPSLVDKYRRPGASKRNIFVLQPLKDIHLHSNLIQEARINGNWKSVYFLTIIAIFILIIAWINYVNLSTAKALDRAKEVGIRKVLGAQRRQLIKQFILESVILNIIAGSVAILLLEFILPIFTKLAGLATPLSMYGDPYFWVFLLLLLLVGTFLSGVYPAVMLSSYKPISVLKGKFRNSETGLMMRKGLVVFQFSASVVLIAGTLIVYQQIEYMMQQDLGINLDQTLVIKAPSVVSNDSLYLPEKEAFRNQLLRIPGVKNVATSSEVPGNLIYWTNSIRTFLQEQENAHNLYRVAVDYDYLSGYDHRFLAGRDFSKNFVNDTTSVIINESTLKILEFETPQQALNKFVVSGGEDTLKIIGVVADYHQEGLKKAHDPIAFLLVPDNRRYFSIKVETNNFSSLVGAIESQFNESFPGNPFSHFFLDEHFDQQYQSDRSFGQIFGVFASFAIIVACLGLFGLSSFTALQRTKEIGVRKVLGASVANILTLLSKDFVKLILIANVISWPIIYLVMNNWLENFANRINIGIGLYLVPGLMVLLITLFTVSYQSVMAATANPVKALRDE